jgi:hypothetical protein
MYLTGASFGMACLEVGHGGTVLPAMVAKETDELLRRKERFTGFRRIQIDKNESSLCWSANLTRRLFGRNVKYELGFERTKLAGANGRKD